MRQLQKAEEGAMMLRACSEFLPTCRDPKRCHICREPMSAHPTDNDRAYWFEWLVTFTLLELQFATQEDIEA
jgi:hypothetical protein